MNDVVNDVVIYTDGACKGNPGPGGWGVLLVSPDGTEKELFGGELGTTNNRMEMMAVIQALAVLKRPCVVTLHGLLSAASASITADSSIRLLVVPNSPPKISFSTPP